MLDELIQNGIINVNDVEPIKEWANNNGFNIMLIDASFVLPNSDINVEKSFIQSHIPNARFFDFKSISDKTSDLPHMLPDQATFSNAMQSMGVEKNDIVIVYGQSGMIMGPARAWWMLRGFGHINVLVLNGGFPEWLHQAMPTQSGHPAHHPPTHYTANSFTPDRLISMQELIPLTGDQSATIIDARPAARFSGTAAEPRSGMRSGHIKDSINLPCSLLIGDTGCFKSKEEIKGLFQERSIILNNAYKIITTCGSGITACALSLALHYIGSQETRVYDGSWSEWGQETSPTKVVRS